MLVHYISTHWEHSRIWYCWRFLRGAFYSISPQAPQVLYLLLRLRFWSLDWAVKFQVSVSAYAILLIQFRRVYRRDLHWVRLDSHTTEGCARRGWSRQRLACPLELSILSQVNWARLDRAQTVWWQIEVQTNLDDYTLSWAASIHSSSP